MRKLLVLIIATVLLASVPIARSTQAISPKIQTQVYTVRHVIDGDTLVLTNNQKVRLIGIDTPEIDDKWNRNNRSAKQYGRSTKVVDFYAQKAKRFAAEQVEGREVALEFDPSNASKGHKDSYGRLLAYVYRLPDRFFLNEELITQGYGFVYKRFSFKHLEDFKESESRAREQRRGLWT